MFQILLLLVVVTTAVQETPSSALCSEGGIFYLGHCYRPFERHVGYEEAAEACRVLDSTLLTATSPQEKQFILAYLERVAWLGEERTAEERILGKCPAFYPLSTHVWSVPCSTQLAYVCKSVELVPTLAPPTTEEHSSAGCQTNVAGLEEVALEQHNRYRARHRNTPPLCWSAQLEERAVEYAIELGNRGGIDHG